MRLEVVGAIAALLTVVATDVGAQQVTLTGTVIDSVTRDPVEGAMIYSVNGTRTMSDKAGHFRLSHFDPSRDLLSIRRVGYAPQASRLSDVGKGPGVDIGTIDLVPIAVVLDPIRTEAELVKENGQMADFYHRRAGGKGWFLTRDQVAQRNPILTTELLRAAPGIVINCEQGPCQPATRRPYGWLPGQQLCFLQVILDGMPVAMTLDDIPPAWIAGIEVYKSGADTPVEFGTSGKEQNTPMTGTLGGAGKAAPVGLSTPFCGMVVVWTRSRT